MQAYAAAGSGLPGSQSALCPMGVDGFDGLEGAMEAETPGAEGVLYR